MTKKLDLSRHLQHETKIQILCYLERRPLGEVLPLFEKITADLTPPVQVPQTAKESVDGCVASRSGESPPGGRDPRSGGCSVPPLEAEQRGGGTENGAEDIHGGADAVRTEAAGAVR